MPQRDNVILVPYGDDILAVAAQRIIARCNTLPDLTDSVVLLPDLQFAPRLRKHLLEIAHQNGHGALLGPVINTLDGWLNEQQPIEQQVPGRARRELMLVEVMQQHPTLFNGADTWQISSSLISLFDELTLNRISIPQDLAAFTARLQAAYGIQDHLPEPLGMEASMVHRLWQAWHAQLNDERMLDPGVASLLRLSQQQAATQQHALFFIGHDQLHGAQLEWLESRLAHDHAECILYRHSDWLDGEHHSPLRQLIQQAQPVHKTDARSACLDAVFSIGEQALVDRVAAITRHTATSPLVDHLAILSAASPEQEARGIDIQVRQWLIEGKERIAIVSEDRRLARRVRALLERAGISLQDSGGWALSTTSAAAVLERWLETVEEDFAHIPLLDVLKSPFIFPDADRDDHAGLVYRLEQDIIQRENIASGLQRYRRHIDYRLARLDQAATRETAEQLHQLLNRLDQAAEPLRPFLTAEHTRPAELLERLRDGLESLGLWSAFESDTAGQRIIQEWQLLTDAAASTGLTMSWVEFRAWLGTALERHDFVPATFDSPVHLLTLQQAQPGQFDGLIVAAADREYLPARRAASPFFNDPVRSDLGLPVWSDHYQLQLHRLRRLLESAPKVLMTWHEESSGDVRMPSPWLEAIRSFHELAWGDDLAAVELAALVEHPDAQVTGSNPVATPQQQSFPRAQLPASLLPANLTVSMHRNLIDCPYKFFAGSGLKLKPRDDVKEAFEKAEYGSLVHQSLEIFHKGKAGYPAPFTAPITRDNEEQAIAALVAISDAVFTRELEDNFEHRAWRRRWRVLIPEYIRWQIKHQLRWTFAAAEQPGELVLTPAYTLSGRLDRVDQDGPDTLVLDYKTGGTPGQGEVDSGEEVQLPSYALLMDTLPQRVEYLSVDGKVAGRSYLEGEALADIAAGVKERLVTVLGEIEAGKALPAWGDVDTCKYCEMSGLCRQQAWADS